MTLELLNNARKSYLASLKDPEATSALLLDLLDQAEQQTPDLLKTFQTSTDKNILEADPVSWSDVYFSRQILLAEHNFSRERIEHLLQVRDHLREQGVKGFVHTPNSSKAKRESDKKVSSAYVPSLNLKKFVSEGHLLTVRTALSMELNDNSLSGQELRAAIAWTKASISGLFEPYIEKAFARGFESSPSRWISKYYDSQVVYLDTNFAEQRFLHLIEVREHLRQQGVDGFVAVAPKPRSASSVPADVQVQSNRQGGHSPHAHPQHTPPGRNPAFKAALLIGGALAALVVFLVALVK